MTNAVVPHCEEGAVIAVDADPPVKSNGSVLAADPLVVPPGVSIDES
jgi:hypothetical protein